MGKIKQGILGGFSGKVGPVIGSSWKGKAYMKSIPLSFNDANSELQQMQRTKFRLVSKFIFAIASFLRIGFRSLADGITEVNAAMSVNLKSAISGTWPNYSLDYSKALVSKGGLDNVYNPTMSFQDTEMELSWSDNSGIGNAKATDNVMVLIYNATKNESKVDTNVAARNERTASMSVPSAWTGDTVHVYLAVKRDDNNETSNSVYLGTQVIS